MKWRVTPPDIHVHVHMGQMFFIYTPNQTRVVYNCLTEHLAKIIFHLADTTYFPIRILLSIWTVFVSHNDNVHVSIFPINDFTIICRQNIRFCATYKLNSQLSTSTLLHDNDMKIEMFFVTFYAYHQIFLFCPRSHQKWISVSTEDHTVKLTEDSKHKNHKTK